MWVELCVAVGIHPVSKYTPNKTHPMGNGSNLHQERINVCKQEVTVAHTYTSFNHNNKKN